MHNHKRRYLAWGSALLAGAALAGCAGTYDPPEMGDELLWTSSGDDDRPGWTLIPDQGEAEEDHRLFVGVSNRHSSQRGARDAATRDAKSVVSQYVYTHAEGYTIETEAGDSRQSDPVDPAISLDALREFSYDFAVREMDVIDWRFEQWWDEDTEESFYKAFALVQIPNERLSLASEGDGIELEEQSRE